MLQLAERLGDQLKSLVCHHVLYQMQLHILQTRIGLENRSQFEGCLRADAIDSASKSQRSQFAQRRDAVYDMEVAIIAKIFSAHPDLQILQLTKIGDGFAEQLPSLILDIVEIEVESEYFQRSHPFDQ